MMSFSQWVSTLEVGTVFCGGFDDDGQHEYYIITADGDFEVYDGNRTQYETCVRGWQSSFDMFRRETYYIVHLTPHICKIGVI